MSIAAIQHAARMRDYRSLVLGMRPVAYWRLGETNGTTAMDEVGGIDGQHNGGPILGEPGPLNRSNGTSTRYLNSSSVFTLMDEPTCRLRAGWSFAAWYRRDGNYSGAQNIIEKDAGSNGGYRVYYSNQGLYFLTRPGGNLELTTAGPVGNDDQWHLVVATYDASRVPRIYFDGELKQADPAQSAVNPAPSSELPEVGESWDGWLDEVAIWHRALSDQEIQDLYNAGIGA